MRYYIERRANSVVCESHGTAYLNGLGVVEVEDIHSRLCFTAIVTYFSILKAKTLS